MKNQKTNDILKNFGERLKVKSDTPLQEVKPILKFEKAESQLNVWIPNDLMKKVKLFGIETGKSSKELTIEALEKLLQNT